MEKHKLRNGPFFLSVSLTLSFAFILDFYIFHSFTPTYIKSSLDESWMSALAHDTFLGAQWGQDVIFTYGPFNQLVTNKFTPDYISLVLPTLFFTCITCGLLFAWIFQLSRSASSKGLLSCFPALAMALSVVFSRKNPDAIYISFVFPLFILLILSERTSFLQKITLHILVFISGSLALIKTSYAIAPLGLYALVDLNTLLRRNRPIATALFFSGFFTFFVLSGQSLASLGAFFAGQLQPALGYADAMSLPFQTSELIVYTLVSVTGLTLVFVESRLTGYRFAILGVGFGLTNFVAFKAGMVRADFHTLISWAVLSLTSSSLFATMAITERTRAYLVTCLSFVIFCLGAGPYFYFTGLGHGSNLTSFAEYYSSLARPAHSSELKNALQAFISPQHYANSLEDENVKSIALVAKSLPITIGSGTVDTVLSLQSEIIASELNADFRPSVQSYGTYTKYLMDRNFDFYNRPNRPDWVLFSPETIDDRLPALCEAEIWPLLLSTYKKSNEYKDFVLLKRREDWHPATSIRTGSERVIPLTEAIKVPEGDLVTAKIELNLSLLGRIVAFVFRPPIVGITLHFKDESQKSFRIVRGIASNGFLLSPFVESGADFARLMDSLAKKNLRKVDSFTVDIPDRTSFLFAPDMAVQFYELSSIAKDQQLTP